MKFVFIVFISLHTFGTYAQVKDLYIARSNIVADYDYLYNSLQETHYNLYAYTSKEKYDRYVEEVRNSIKADSLSLLNTVSLFQKVVSYANVGHCEIDYPAQSYITYATNGGTVFPLELAFEENHVYVRKNFSSNNSFSVGDELLSIDNIPIYEIQKQLYPFVSAEREYLKKAKIEFWSFPRLFFQVFGEKEKWSITIKNSNNKTIHTQIKSIPVMAYETSRNGEILNFKRIFKYYDKTAYLNPGPFGGLNDLNGEIEFKVYIDSVFADIKLHSAKNLIIDLRNNPGGHNAYSDYLISYFAKEPFKWHSSFTVKTSEILKNVTRLQNDTTDNYARAILTKESGKVFDYTYAPFAPQDKTKRYTGKIYVLINRQTYSMAAVSAALIQDYRFAKIIGEETGDLPTLYASQFSFPLPNTGIVIKVPKSYIVRSNESERLEGVKPDIKVKDHLLDEKDEILEKILERLK